MKDIITKRLKEIIDQGDALMNHSGKISNGWASRTYNSEFQSWITSATNILQLVSPKNSIYLIESERLLNHKDLTHGIPEVVPQKMLGLVKSAFEEWNNGLLRKIEYIVVAGAFDDFLDHAEGYHKGGKKTESAVLASAVLEDTVKKIASKNDIDSNGSLEPLIDRLIQAEILTPVKGKRVKAYAGTRNKAFHAEWDGFDIKDVGEMIKGIRELIEDYL